ncbi:MAG: UDP-glucuronate 4-epimerase [Gammaproteobacteria bacterium]|nr:UDP-glucuronate 4-epimerase [Gammaproteobacteria bacterium]
MKVLVTGVAGFIGSFTAQRLIERGDEVVGLDNLNDYYDVSLKRARLARLDPYKNFRFLLADLADQAAIAELFATEKFDRVVHLGAQAGVRYSLQAPHSYIQSNITGTMNVLEGCRHNAVAHLVYASSSSVYGASARLPYSVHEPASHPVSLYAATKRSNELMAHCYSSVFGLPTTGLRFFTVYGPWGRPDMALFLFSRAILTGQPIQVFNYGHHRRDFTYVDDIVEGVVRVLDRVAQPNPQWDGSHPDPASSPAPYRIYNIGSNRPVELLRYIEVLEECLGRKAEKILLPLQPGDVADTFADVRELVDDIGYQPTTPVEVGVRNFVDWYRGYYADQA